MDVEIKLLDNAIGAPSYAKPGDAGLDLRSAENVVIAPGERATVGCGFAIAIPQGYAGLVIPRSGLASKSGITIVNAPGLIDSGYRGEVKVILANTDKSEEFAVARGDRIAQLMLVKIPEIDLIPSDYLSETERGEGGFGSTGA